MYVQRVVCDKYFPNNNRWINNVPYYPIEPIVIRSKKNSCEFQPMSFEFWCLVNSNLWFLDREHSFLGGQTFFIIVIFFFFWEFQPMVSAPDDSFLSSTKTPINFWCKRGLNLKSLIQHQRFYQLSVIVMLVLNMDMPKYCSNTSDLLLDMPH